MGEVRTARIFCWHFDDITLVEILTDMHAAAVATQTRSVANELLRSISTGE